MEPLTERDIRASFINCTKGETKRLVVPRDLAERPWDDLDFLGWSDPGAPDRAYLVTRTAAGPIGVALRRATPSGHLRRSMCTLCLTTHPGDGVSLMTARKAGRSGQAGNSVGAYLCSDLACSLYLRGKKDAGSGGRVHESLSLEEKVERTGATLAGFLARVAA
ncbi:FBP domain-containing protein [Umezawaea beigongshangensis]|uniref:FBP domain-containing protein n=1 Tax=Umezawaea beigongshangensis TaxID=2780383 RepID=UPI0018F121FB|nr:FBP domain-containing protein [Umezawaea beigongshangensis]